VSELINGETGAEDELGRGGMDRDGSGGR